MTKRNEPSRSWQIPVLAAMSAIVIVLSVMALRPSGPDGSTAARSSSPEVSPTNSSPPARVALQAVKASNGRSQPVAFVLGDSYSDSAGATTAAKGYPALVGTMFGWRIVTDSLLGGGYVNAGPDKKGPLATLAEQANLAKVKPDVIVLQAGINDAGYQADKLRAGVSATIDQLRTQAPGVPIVVVGLLWPSKQPSYVATARDAIKIVAEAKDETLYIDTTGWEYQTVYDHVHPSDQGHAYLAQRISEAITKSSLA